MIRYLEVTEREALLEALELVQSVAPDDPFLAESVAKAERALDEALTTDEVED